MAKAAAGAVKTRSLKKTASVKKAPRAAKAAPVKALPAQLTAEVKAAKERVKVSSTTTRQGGSIFGFDFATSFQAFHENSFRANEGYTQIVYCGDEKAHADMIKKVEKEAFAWQVSLLVKNQRELNVISLPQGPFGLILPRRPNGDRHRDHQMHILSPYAQGREMAGQLFAYAEAADLRQILVRFERVKAEELQGFLVGLDMAYYRYLRYRPGKRTPVPRPQFFIVGVEGKSLHEARLTANAVNLARHLVNLPPSELNPITYADAVQGLFKGVPDVSVEVWDEKRLAAERMNLHRSVGKAAEEKARLVKISYRPKHKGKVHPLVFVGKGVTFDSGGLDLKPADGMRFMKKDMGGSAAVCALAHWVAHHGYFKACDFYLCLAENAIDASALKPGDVLYSRGGQAIEIDNTDAEGRLVMADTLELATEAGQDPECVIDVATLTGAIKVGLGNDLGGLFANDHGLSADLLKAAQGAGDPLWPMPLYSPYDMQLRTPMGDMKNSASSRFGGAITAALFLEKFVNGRPWAHLDIYAWNEMPRGALREVGASGQAVQLLINFLLHARLARHT